MIRVPRTVGPFSLTAKVIIMSLGHFIRSDHLGDAYGDASVSRAVVEAGSIGVAVSGEALVADESSPSYDSDACSATASVQYSDQLTFFNSSLPVGTPIVITEQFGIFGKSYVDSSPVNFGGESSQSYTGSRLSVGLTGTSGSQSGPLVLTASSSASAGVPTTSSTVTPGTRNYQQTILNGSTYVLTINMSVTGGASGEVAVVDLGPMPTHHTFQRVGRTRWPGVE